jgi:DNA-binding NarL/FixJ family response regulator
MTMMAGDSELVPVGTAPTLIIEPREVTAAGLESVLRRNGIAVAGIARDGSEGVVMASATKPSVVLLDVNLPDMSAVRTAKQILKQGGHIRVLALADATDEAIVGRFLLAGFHGQVRVDADGMEIAAAVRRAAVPVQTPLPPGPEEVSTDSPESSERLTSRELEVLRLLAIGLRNDQIAGKLYLSPHTVRTHVQNIRRKLGVRSRLEAVLLAIRWGLAEPGEARSA